jgi:hypothetical protein
MADDDNIEKHIYTVEGGLGVAIMLLALLWMEVALPRSLIEGESIKVGIFAGALGMGVILFLSGVINEVIVSLRKKL